jgi:electron transfer flavoprotein alpha/beta subunit
MKVLTCFKVVPDLKLLTDEDWQVVDNQVEVGFVENDWNPFDESALEMTLKLSDLCESFNGSMGLTVISVGSKKIDSFLKTLLALKFQHAVRIETEQDLRFNPHQIAAWLAGYVKKIPQDMVVMGVQSGVGDNAQTPLLVAEILEWPCITQVIGIKPESNGCLRVTSQMDDGVLEQVIKPPVVLSVGNAPNSFLRVPTLKDKLNYGKRPVEVLTPTDIIVEDNTETTVHPPKLIKLCNIENQRYSVKIENGTPKEKATMLFNRYLKQRLKKL